MASKFKEYIMIIPSLNSPSPTDLSMTLPVPVIFERVFSCLAVLELHNFTQFKPKIFLGEDPETPLTNTFYKVKN